MNGKSVRPEPVGLIENVRAVMGLITDRRLATFEGLMKTHPTGAVLRLPGQRVLVTATPSANRTVLVEQHTHFVKGMGQKEAASLIGDGLLTAEGAAWRLQRDDTAPLLRARRVHDHQAAIMMLANASTAQLPPRIGEEVQLRNLLAQYTLDTLGHVLGFTAPPAQEVAEALDVVQAWAMFDTVSLGVVPHLAVPRAHARLRRALATLNTHADATLRQLDNQPAQWATRSGLISLFLAGYETTSSTLGWAVHYLSQNPRWQVEIASEYRSRSEESAGSPLPVATAVFRETLRLRPPVWLISRQATQATTVDGFLLRPKDQVVLLVARGQRDGWARPDHFDPRRFLRDSSAGRFAPFGAGPRGCPGGTLAELEASEWLAAACARTRFRPAPGRRPNYHARLSLSLPPDWTTVLDSAGG